MCVTDGWLVILSVQYVIRRPLNRHLLITLRDVQQIAVTANLLSLPAQYLFSVYPKRPIPIYLVRICSPPGRTAVQISMIYGTAILEWSYSFRHSIQKFLLLYNTYKICDKFSIFKCFEIP